MVILMISEGMLLKNTLKPLPLEADISILYLSKGEFQMDIALHRNVHF